MEPEFFDGLAHFNNTMVGNMTNVTDLIEAVRPDRHPLPRWLVYTYICLILFGLFSNSVDLVVLSRLKTSVMYVYLTGLALLELVFVLALSGAVWMQSLGFTEHRAIVEFNIYFATPCWQVASSASLLLTVVIALDRVYHVLRPINARQTLTPVRARLLIALTIVTAVLTRLPFVLLLAVDAGTLEDERTVYWITLKPTSAQTNFWLFLSMAVIFEYLAPLALTVSTVVILTSLHTIRQKRRLLNTHRGRAGPTTTTNTTVWATTGDTSSTDGASTTTMTTSTTTITTETCGWPTPPTPSTPPTPGASSRTPAPLGSSGSAASPSRDERLMVVLILLSVVTIVCNSPVTILRLIWPDANEGNTLKNMANVLYCLNHVCNMFLYIASDATFRRCLVSLGRRCCCCRPRPASPPHPVHTARSTENF